MRKDMAEYIVERFGPAMDHRHIQAFYQPVIRTVSGNLCSFEALARWTDPEFGMIYPDEFIPVLEKNRQIHLLDAYILRQVCARIRKSFENGDVPVPVSVNLSRLDFALCDVFEVCDGIVSEYQIPHDFIYFEITESTMAEQKDEMSAIVGRFRSAGYQIWMDDFGSAYSSLNLLKDYEFDELKLDMGFLHPFTQRSKRIATAVVEMAKGIDIHTLAEGVETEEQFLFFRNIGCEKVQGYYFGKPMLYENAIDHLRERGIAIELAADRQYFDEIGRIDLLSAVPFMTAEERDAIRTARQLNSIPLALIEVREQSYSVLFYNSAFEDTTRGTGIYSLCFDQDALGVQRPFHAVSDKFITLMDSAHLNGDGRMTASYNESYYEIKAKCVARTPGKYCVLLQVNDLSRASRDAGTDRLDEYLRRIYAIFQRITLIDLREDTITPLYTSTRRDLVSGRKGIKTLFREFAADYIFREDREEYLRLTDPDTLRERFRESGQEFVTRAFRISIRHGQYAWRAFTLLRVNEDSFLLLISDLQDAIPTARRCAERPDAVSCPENLWRNLVESDIIRLFWKDRDRRFLGASKAFLDYYGFPSADEIIGKTDEDLGWHIRPDSYMNDELRVIHEGVATCFMPGLCLNEGQNVEIMASKTPLYDHNGKINGLIGYFIDRRLLTVNDVRGEETVNRDLLTGLLNSRGIAEEAARFRDEYHLRGVDFVRIHIAINDFSTLNEQYGFDFGDKVMAMLGKKLRDTFGRSSAVGRYSGHKFVVLHQVYRQEEIRELRDRIKATGESIHSVGGIPVTLYLSVGYVLFSEYTDLEEQASKSEVRLLADHDRNVSAESRMANALEIFHLFDDLPIIYAVYHVTVESGPDNDDAVLFYVNHFFEELAEQSAEQLLGRPLRELYPFLDETWYGNIKRAALLGEPVDDVFRFPLTGKRYHYIARQIIYPGYCAVTYSEIRGEEDHNP